MDNKKTTNIAAAVGMGNPHWRMLRPVHRPPEEFRVMAGWPHQVFGCGQQRRASLYEWRFLYGGGDEGAAQGCRPGGDKSASGLGKALAGGNGEGATVLASPQNMNFLTIWREQSTSSARLRLLSPPRGN
jgi:hypothetical protein